MIQRFDLPCNCLGEEKWNHICLFSRLNYHLPVTNDKALLTPSSDTHFWSHFSYLPLVTTPYFSLNSLKCNNLLDLSRTNESCSLVYRRVCSDASLKAKDTNAPLCFNSADLAYRWKLCNPSNLRGKHCQNSRFKCNALHAPEHLEIRGLFISQNCFFVCLLEFFVPFNNFSLIWRCQLYQ